MRDGTTEYDESMAGVPQSPSLCWLRSTSWRHWIDGDWAESQERAPVAPLRRPPLRTYTPRAFGLLLLLSVFTVGPAQAVMSNQERQVATAPELTAAAADAAAVGDIVVTANLTGLPTFRLSPGETLRGARSNVTLRFAAGQDGVQLSSDNQVETRSRLESRTSAVPARPFDLYLRKNL